MKKKLIFYENLVNKKPNWSNSLNWQIRFFIFCTKKTIYLEFYRKFCISTGENKLILQFSNKLDK